MSANEPLCGDETSSEEEFQGHGQFHKHCYSDPLDLRSRAQQRRPSEEARARLRSNSAYAKQVWATRREESALEREQARLKRKGCPVPDARPPQSPGSLGRGKNARRPIKPPHDPNQDLQDSPLPQQCSREKFSAASETSVKNDSNKSTTSTASTAKSASSQGSFKSTIKNDSNKSTTSTASSAKSASSQGSFKSTTSDNKDQSESGKSETGSGSLKKDAGKKDASSAVKRPCREGTMGKPVKKQLSKKMERVQFKGEETVVSVGVEITAKARPPKSESSRSRSGACELDGEPSSTSSIFDPENRTLLYLTMSLVISASIAVPLFLSSHKFV